MEGRVLTVEYPPGVHGPSHHHLGWQYIHVLGGNVTHQIEDEEPREHKAGQVWYEARDHFHLYIGNDSPDV
ncbi:MAG: cupin domain-containing protein [Rubrobacter sp.]|nr:cupin domain-containing protein [Rubrobacter sp.]